MNNKLSYWLDTRKLLYSNLNFIIKKGTVNSLRNLNLDVRYVGAPIVSIRPKIIFYLNICKTILGASWSMVAWTHCIFASRQISHLAILRSRVTRQKLRQWLAVLPLHCLAGCNARQHIQFSKRCFHKREARPSWWRSRS